jgi:pyruvate/2-oxoglutarate dehydrogenase complex dihydrolipoamide acyltransferase (E2) component
VAKKTKKQVKRLTKAVEALQEQNEDFAGALEAQDREIQEIKTALNSDSPVDADEPEATEAAERTARELDVELSEVDGTGTEGRILVKDVEDAAEPEGRA